jgi:Na+/proline symporter
MEKNYIKKPTNRNFGIVFFIVFFLIAFYPLTKNNNIILWSLFVAFIFLILGILNSKLLTPLNKIWFKFGLILGKIVSPFVMAIIFFFVVTPTGIFMRLFRKDLLNLKFNTKDSYWIKKNEPKSKMKNQF